MAISLTGGFKVDRSFDIRADDMENFTAAFEKANKGGFFTVSFGEVFTKYYYNNNVISKDKYIQILNRGNTNVYQFNFLRVTITGEVPGIPGYAIVGRVDETEGNRIVHNFSDMDVSDHRTIPLYCHHCNTNHHRKSTYLFSDLVSNEIFQVGNTCVGHYTGTQQDITKVIIRLFALVESYGIDSNEYDESFGSSAPKFFGLDYIVALALGVAIKHGGYSKSDEFTSGTKDTVFALLNNNGKEYHRELLKYHGVKSTDEMFTNNVEAATALIEYFKTCDIPTGQSGDYLFNCKSIAETGCVSYKRIGIAVSMVAQYFRANKQEIQYTDEYLGTEKQKFKNVSVTVIDQRQISSQFGMSQKVTLRTNSGHKLLWWNKNCDSKVGETMVINFTVKEIDTYDKKHKSVVVYYVKPQ